MVDLSLYDNLLDIVKMRRNVRQFKTDPVPDEYIKRIVEVAKWAPSGFHTQPWEFLVIRKKEVKDRICDIIEQNRSTPRRPGSNENRPGGYRDAPVFIILLGDRRASIGLPGPVRENSERVSQFFCSSLAGAFLYMHIAAATLGLASQWYSSSGDLKVETEIKKFIGIPEELYIYDMMVLGYALRPPVPKITRKLEEMIHYDDCGIDDFRTQEKVEADAEISMAWCHSAH
jgi:nicotinate-nucleotide--dimethylbenzimidazole phosphoribosyltransferase